MSDDIRIEFLEEEIITVDFIEEIPINVNLTKVDLLKNLSSLLDVLVTSPQEGQRLAYISGQWVNIDPTDLNSWITNEVPTKITSTNFRTANNYINNTLKIFLNGMKIIDSDVTEDPNNAIFTLAFDTVVTDKIEVEYIRT